MVYSSFSALKSEKFDSILKTEKTAFSVFMFVKVKMGLRMEDNAFDRKGDIRGEKC